MIRVRDERDQINVAKVYRANQGHIFQFWDELDRDERKHLLGQIEQVDFQLVERLIALHKNGASNRDGTLIKNYAPPETVPCQPSSEVERSRREHARAVGEEALRDGRVAVFTVAGGQGTRLGWPGPKGAYPIGPVSQKPIFQILAEKIIASSKRYKTTIPWFIMVSTHNREETEQLFQDHNYFGLSPLDVFFMTQGELPAVSFSGKILMADRHRLAMSPNGHGGAIEALYSSGALKSMERRGIDLISYLQVDNPLAIVVDPAFLGYHLLAESDMSTKVVPKQKPGERVGVLASVDGELRVVEYTELSDELRNRREPDGRLSFRAGNTAMHVFSRGFLEQLNQDGFTLPFHRARKKVPWADRRGVIHQPTEPNAIKFESFIFDALSYADNPMVVEISREQEFAPLKSREGKTSPEAVKGALTACYAEWLEAAGVELPRTPQGEVQAVLEISPLTALDAVQLADVVDDMELDVEPDQEVLL